MQQGNTYTVYEHINKENGKRYIGQTGLSLWRRWQGGKGYANQPRFYDDILAYGWSNFEHNVIAEGLTKEESKKLEKELINKYETWNNANGYNTYSAEWLPKKKSMVYLDHPVLCVETGIMYDSVYAAAAAMNLSSYKCIARVINDPTKKSRRFHWVQPPIRGNTNE